MDFKLVLDKLGQLFLIRTILFEGGGSINGSLRKAELVDELGLLHTPYIDGAANSAADFEQGEQPGPPAKLRLKQLPDDQVGLRFHSNGPSQSSSSSRRR